MSRTLLIGFALVCLGATVATTASVDPSTTLHPNAAVGDYATIGPDMVIGDVVVAARATLVGRQSGTVGQTIGDLSFIGRSATLGADSTMGADSMLGRSTTTGARTTIGAGASVGYANTLGTDVQLGANAVLGNLVTLGDRATVNGVVARNVSVGEDAVINGIVGADVMVGARAQVAGRVRKNSTIEADAVVQAGATIGRGATIHAGAVVGTGARVATGATVPACAQLGMGDVVRRGVTFEATTYVADCTAPGVIPPWFVQMVAGSPNWMTGVAAADDGRVYGSGFMQGTGNFGGTALNNVYSGSWVAALEPDGSVLWARRLDSGFSAEQVRVAYADGYVYVVGRHSRGFNNGDISVPDLQSSGTSIFALQLDATDGSSNWEVTSSAGNWSLESVDADVSGVYFGGTHYGGSITLDGVTVGQSSLGSDAYLYKVSPTGDALWGRRLGSSQNVLMRSITTSEADDSVYITAAFEGTLDAVSPSMLAGVSATGSGRNGVVVRLSPSGATRDSWVFAPTAGAFPLSVQSHPSGVVVAGVFTGTASVGSTSLDSGTASQTFIVDMTTDLTATNVLQTSGSGGVEPTRVERLGDHYYFIGRQFTGDADIGPSSPYSVAEQTIVVAKYSLANAAWVWRLDQAGALTSPRDFAAARIGASDHLYFGMFGAPGYTIGSDVVAGSDSSSQGFIKHITGDGNW